ncbi:hypothetical protein J2S74_002984 [Evansella vedderi]|uniref:Uncharacterized protein n=1 Tax=Evansella vedderi TaxID=38282 RepID=A0ABT9ZWK4_9BACI|nr:hypothetical protein [Evansella vedderi]MDQ0255602.1 hypothetical protein [Evansella vedderi]
MRNIKSLIADEKTFRDDEFFKKNEFNSAIANLEEIRDDIEQKTEDLKDIFAQ